MNIHALLKNSTAIIIIRGGAALVTFLITLFLARKLSIDVAGQFFFLLSVVTFFSVVVRAGLDNPIIRFGAKFATDNKKEELAWLLKTALILVSIVSLIISIILYIWSNYIDIDSSPNSIIFFAIPGVALTFLMGCAVQGIKNPISGAFLKNALVPFSFAIVLLVQFYNNTLDPFVGYFIASLGSLIFIIYVVYRFLQHKPAQTTNIFKRELKSAAFALFLTQSFQQLNQYGGQFILAAFSTESELAIFNVSFRVSILCSFILIAINNVLAPSFAKIDPLSDKVKLQKLVSNAAKIIWVVAFFFFFLVIFGAGYIAELFGKNYAEAATIIKILVFGQIVNALTGPVGYLLTMNGFEKKQRNNVFIATLISLTMGLILVPQYEVVGAAIATVIGISTANILSWFTVRRVLKINPSRFW